MSILEALLLGLIQGLTEFIPISSTAHLTIAGRMLDLIDPNNPQQWTAFIAVIQLGTLVAVIVFFWTDIINIVSGFISSNLALLRKRPLSAAQIKYAKLGWLIIIGSLPIAIVGLLFRDVIEGSLTKDLRVIAGSLIGLAIILTIAEIIGKQKRGMDQLRVSDALTVGVAQVFALIPGSSRSGTTITGGLFAGLTREAAARFSFLLSIPAIAASGLLELPEAMRSVTESAGDAIQIGWAQIILATLAAAVSGYASIAFLLRFLQRHTTYLFVGYRVALGVVLIVLILAGMT
jgi:undecaprenyl-diphosphatase